MGLDGFFIMQAIIALKWIHVEDKAKGLGNPECSKHKNKTNNCVRNFRFCGFRFMGISS